jgi:hypothetical protein
MQIYDLNVCLLTIKFNINSSGRDTVKVSASHNHSVLFPDSQGIIEFDVVMPGRVVIDVSGINDQSSSVELCSLALDDIKISRRYLADQVFLVPEFGAKINGNFFCTNGSVSIDFTKSTAFSQILEFNGDLNINCE